MNKSKISNFFFLVVIVLLIVPQTRTSIQVVLHKAIALVNPVSIRKENKRAKLTDYDWNLIDENEVVFNFKNNKGKVIVVNFWATWCAPCIAEMPSLQKLYDTYGDKVAFMFITNDPLPKIEDFKTKHNYTFPVYLRRFNTPEILITKSIPRTLLIDQNGEILIDKSSAVDWFSVKIRKEIEKLIKAI